MATWQGAADLVTNYLQGPDHTPTILFVHHTFADGDGDLLDAPRLFDLVTPAKKVKAIIYGHSHSYGYSEFKGGPPDQPARERLHL